MTRVLALDVGTSSVRARIYDATGTVQADEVAQTRYEVTHSPGGRVDVDADHLVESVRAAIDAILSPGEHIDAFAASCFWHSLLPLDRAGRPLGPLLIWQDTRSVAQVAQLRSMLDPEPVHARTGCPLHPSFWPAKLRWLADECPDVFDSATRFACFSSYLYEQLAGEGRTSLSMASATGLLDQRTNTWDEELLDAVGVEPERLPAISEEPVGASVPWFPARGDGACSNLGVGCVTADRAALTIGTSAALRVLFSGEPEPPAPGLFLYRLDAERPVTGGALSDGGNLLAWLMRTLRLPEAPAIGARLPDAHGLTFLPLLGGERSPGWKGHARGAVAGLSFDTGPLDLLQAGLEGVAYLVAEIADRLPPVREVVATGGALRDDPSWTQILADVLERPVVASAVPEGSARGAACLALERLGERPRLAPLGASFYPREDRQSAYRLARERQRRLYEELT